MSEEDAKKRYLDEFRQILDLDGEGCVSATRHSCWEHYIKEKMKPVKRVEMELKARREELEARRKALESKRTTLMEQGLEGSDLEDVEACHRLQQVVECSKLSTACCDLDTGDCVGFFTRRAV